MATVADIVTRALRRLRIVGAEDSPSAADMALGISALNDMLRSWPAQGVDILQQADYASTDTFVFFVPPVGATATLISALEYQSTWNASTNSPALASSSGTKGYVYRVATAGSTTLDDVASWAANDFAVFDGTAWVKGKSSRRHDAAVSALLAMRLAEDFGSEPGAVLVRDARDGWTVIQADYIVPATNAFDRGLSSMPSQRYWP